MVLSCVGNAVHQEDKLEETSNIFLSCTNTVLEKDALCVHSHTVYIYSSMLERGNGFLEFINSIIKAAHARQKLVTAV